MAKFKRKIASEVPEEGAGPRAQTLHYLFSLKVADVDAECREFFQISRQREMAKFKRKIANEVAEEGAGPRAQTRRRTPMAEPIIDLNLEDPNLDVDICNSQDGANNSPRDHQ